jgi:hypothetical protein
MKTRLFASAIVIAAGTLLATALPVWAGEVTGMVEKVDASAGTITVNGETIKVPAGMNVEGIMEGSEYMIMYSGEGTDKTLTQFEAKRKG